MAALGVLMAQAEAQPVLCGVSPGQSGAASSTVVCGVLWPLGEGQPEKNVALGAWWKEGHGFVQGTEEEC